MRAPRRDSAPDQAPAVLPSGPECPRCGGHREGERVEGGWLTRWKQQGESWYAIADACPDCAFGFYRVNTAHAPRYSQFPEATALDIAKLAGYLRRGVTMAQAIDAVPFGEVRARLRDLSAGAGF
jgi:hypothetical protein